MMLRRDVVVIGAGAVGYDNSMYFSRIFKKHTGLTPTDYKKRYKN